MATVEFLKPRFVGTRFDGHALPLELLKDLAALEEMVVEVAKWKFRQEHPDRKRAPRGFMEGVELRLTAVEDGSARPVISLFVAAIGLLPASNQEYLEKSRDSIARAISAAEHSTPVTDHLPVSALGYFDRIGRGLREGEVIEFPVPGESAPARLTRETRRKLVLAASNVREFTEETVTRGVVPEADQDDMTFEIQTADGRKIKAPMPSQHMDTILEAFVGYSKGVRIMLKGIGRFSRQGRLDAFESIEHAACLDPLDVPARLDELRVLEDGWLEGRGKAPDGTALDWLAAAFAASYPDDLALPYLYPTAEGGIQTEWTLGKNEITLAIDLASRKAEWHSVNLDSGDEQEQTVDLGSPDGWQWVAENVRRLGGGEA